MKHAVVRYLPLLCLLAAPALGTPPNTATLDGRPLEYDAIDLKGAYTGGGGSFGTNVVVTNLYVTWDTNYLYVALQGWESDNKLVVMLDADPGSGTGATTTTNWTSVEPSFIKYNDVGWQKSSGGGATNFGLDYMIASEGFFNNLLRIVYDGVTPPSTNNIDLLFDSGNGATPLGSAVDMVVQSDTTANDLKGIEARIPWNVLYTTNYGNRFGTAAPIVPVGAVIRVFANVHNNDPAIAYSANDAIPQQTSTNAAYAAGLLTTDNYIDIPVDLNLDGVPDVSALDVNAPYIKFLGGVTSQRVLFVQFNENVIATEATNPANWAVGLDTPSSVSTTAQASTYLLSLTNDLPAVGTLVKVSAINVQDASANTRFTYNYASPVASGITNAMTVRFYLETPTNSGLGRSPGATNFFVNGGAAPLEFGYPPAMSSPLDQTNGASRYRDVIFPPGTPTTFNYKYSGRLTATGTNTYEAVRLADFANATRVMTLDTNVSFMVVTDYLGAAAGPYRDPGTNASHDALYLDPRRGDAGVRQRVTLLFQLDLSGYDLTGIDRVFVQGSDPLRGFNEDDAGFADFANQISGGTTADGGVTMYDDGDPAHGDTNAGDKVYSVIWAATPTGTDSTLVPFSPNSLVGGDPSTLPYGGSGWQDRRSYRSFGYKFYVFRSDYTLLESPPANIERYLPENATNVNLGTFVWANGALPPPPPSNSPTVVSVTLGTTNATLIFTNAPGEPLHGVQISTGLTGPWLDYGHRATGLGGIWTGLVGTVGNAIEFYRAFAGAPQGFQAVRFDPNPMPATGGTLRIWYVQHSRGLAGDRNVQIAGSFSSWASSPMTFISNGIWYADVDVSSATSSNIEFKPRNAAGTVYEGMGGGGDNYRAYKGFGRASWTPLNPTNEEVVTITYDATGTPLTNAVAVNCYMGYEEQWLNASNRPMTSGGPNLWTLTFPIPTGRTVSCNFVFNDGSNWDSESSSAGRLNRIFIAPNPYPSP